MLGKGLTWSELPGWLCGLAVGAHLGAGWYHRIQSQLLPGKLSCPELKMFLKSNIMKWRHDSSRWSHTIKLIHAQARAPVPLSFGALSVNLSQVIPHYLGPKWASSFPTTAHSLMPLSEPPASFAFCHWQQSPAMATLTGALYRYESWFFPSLCTISDHKENKILCLNEKSFLNQQKGLLLFSILINLCKYTTEK